MAEFRYQCSDGGQEKDHLMTAWEAGFAISRKAETRIRDEAETRIMSEAEDRVRPAINFKIWWETDRIRLVAYKRATQ